MKTLTIILLAGTAGLSAMAAPVDWSKLPPAATTEGVTFEKDIKPLFKDSCVRCHSGERAKAQLRLDTLEGVLKGTKKGAVLKAGDSADSQLVKAVSQLDPESAMPPKPRGRGGPGGPGGGFGRPPGANAPEMQPHEGGPGQPPGGPEGTNAPGQPPRGFGPPPKPLTAEQVGLVRAWIDQGAK
jgi:hypothetical protein